jgi:transporter family-2 protein
MPDAKRTAGIAISGGTGVGAAIQSKINGDLGARLHDGIAAATISFVGGLVIIATIATLVPAARRGVARLRTALGTRDIRPWQCLGGAASALVVAGQGLTVSTLGVAVFTVAFVAGQASAGLVVDRAGLGPSGSQPLSGTRMAGAVLAIVAVVVAVADRFGTPTGLALAALPLVGGLGAAVQQAINGQIREATRSSTTATLVNFVVATATLAVVQIVDLAVRGLPARLPATLWLYLGGPLGVIVIAISAAVVRAIGVLLLGLALVAGQLAGALGIDLVAPGSSGRPGASTWLGVALTLVAVGLAARPDRRPGGEPVTSRPAVVGPATARSGKEPQ